MRQSRQSAARRPFILVAVLALALGLTATAGCNNPVASIPRADVHLTTTNSVVTGTPPASVVLVQGTATNVGDAMAHNVTVAAYVDGKSAIQATRPSDIAPGETARWSLKLAGSGTPQLAVGWQ